MEIKRNGFVYRCAYGFIDEDRRPRTVNLCPLFWKFLWMFCCGWPALYIIYAIIIVAIAVFGFFFAARPTILKGEEDIPTPAMHYTHWPRIRGKRIWPIWFALGGLGIWLIYAQGSAIASITVNIAMAPTRPTFWKGFGITAICFTIIALGFRFFNSEAWILLRAWYRARKQKICPIIKVVD